MARVHLADGEDLVATFRPHPGSFSLQYAADLLWVAYGLLAATAALRYADIDTLAAGGYAFSGLALIHAVISRLAGGGIAWGLVWAALGLTQAILVQTGYLPLDLGWLHATALGAFAGLALLGRSEVVRRRRVYTLTDRRLVVTDGVRRRSDRTIDLERVEAVHGHQDIGGQLFRYGTLTLVMERGGRRKADAPPPMEALEGVPRYSETKHRFEATVADRRLPPKERARRAEERRMRESMRAVASWVRTKRA